MIFDDSLYNTALTTVSNLQTTSDEVKLAISEAKKIVNDVNAGKGTIGRLVKDEALYTETTASMMNLKEILQKINQGQGTIGKLVNDMEFYKNAKLTLQKVDKATEGLEDRDRSASSAFWRGTCSEQRWSARGKGKGTACAVPCLHL
ncbi:MAG: hypothetical protein QM813_21750 [Verrucomicrobiota bacterium]